MKYHYKSTDSNGKIQEGFVSADSPEEAAKLVSGTGVVGAEIRRDIWKSFQDWLRFQIGGVSLIEKVMFTKHLAVLVRSQIALDESIFILKEQASGWKMKSILEFALDSVLNGQTLSRSLEHFPKVFGPLFVNVLRAGERSGTLEQSLESLSIQMTKAYELRQKIKSALFYPALVLSLTFILGLFLATFVLPKITTLFSSFRVELPWATRALIAFSSFFQHYGILVFLGVVVGIALWLWILQFRAVRYPVHRLMLKSPLFGKLISDFNLGIFSRTLGTLIKSGVPIVESLQYTSETFNNLIYRSSLAAIAEEVSKGNSVASSLEKYHHLFPPIVYRMVAVGEETGRLEEVLFYLAEFFETEVDTTTKNLSTVIEPLLLLVIGAAVAVVALSIIMPIYQITGSFRSVR
ncbi:MAG: type IV pilus assembly protein PilC [Parcubacteria group bacterium Gr01-1014_18]|nr:MAG: type IV pilus assembly protein PilC [Parcubacteria group bacterium Greene0416_36]TSC79772.1 MAG: type IV pilus assembly protein PilC [Parcubacteria group bacterium Gr01-1014_18]TSC97974.1 MAG: type IV pilus assembly protein PilC [Parcubacteria group bacterium Greene1014_20]TSD06603.1 MAG: type IV pilus assembly protein PilC [Parcubacteria group bacterium Greene0714_2]